jgi:uncharacterized membrane protein YhhN
MHFPPIFFVWLAISLAATSLYGFAFLGRRPDFPRALVKTAAIAALAAAVAQLGAGPGFFLLVVALGASALGDFLLAFEKTWTLALGILAFLVAQLVYVVAFFGLWMMGGDLAPIWPRYAACAVVALLALGFLAWLWREPAAPKGKPHAYMSMLAALGLGFIPLAALPLLFAVGQGTVGNISWPFWLTALAIGAALGALVWMRRDVGAMRIGIMPYAATIAMMAWLAMWAPWQGWPAMLGATLFLMSDGVLAAELFKLPPGAPALKVTRPVVWWTYYAAQVLIAAGVILAARAMA